MKSTIYYAPKNYYSCFLIKVKIYRNNFPLTHHIDWLKIHLKMHVDIKKNVRLTMEKNIRNMILALISVVVMITTLACAGVKTRALQVNAGNTKDRVI